MKKIVLMFAAVALAIPAMGQGVVFEEISIGQALAKAGAENKQVFVDCYTSWCGPCKKMTNDVFPRKDVGDYFGPRFISVKYDMEKDEDGIMLGKEHRVTGYPTYLILNPDGSLLHKFMGAYDAPLFLRKVDESFDDGRAYGSLKKAYDEGNRNRDFLEKALEGFTSVRDPQTQEVVAQLVGQLSDKEKTSPDYWFIYATDLLDTIGSANEKYLFENASRFRKNIGAEKVDPVLERHYYERLMNIIRLKEEIGVKDMDRMAKQIKKLRLGGDVNALTNTAVAVICGDFDTLIAVAADELPGMENPMEPYFMLSDRIKDDGTLEQKRAWIELGEILTPLVAPDKRGWMEAVTKHLREQAGL